MNRLTTRGEDNTAMILEQHLETIIGCLPRPKAFMTALLSMFLASLYKVTCSCTHGDSLSLRPAADRRPPLKAEGHERNNISWT